MKKYDYILVGSGLYSGVFAWFAKQKGKKCPVLENSGSGVIRIIDHRIALYHEKISHIDSHCEK